MVNKITIFLLSLLPVSLILGNFVINLNLLLIDFLVLYQCIIIIIIYCAAQHIDLTIRVTFHIY